MNGFFLFTHRLGVTMDLGIREGIGFREYYWQAAYPMSFRVGS
jgi:hypothetical protein